MTRYLFPPTLDTIAFAVEIDGWKSSFQFRKVLRFRFAKFSIEVPQHFLGLMFAFPDSRRAVSDGSSHLVGQPRTSAYGGYCEKCNSCQDQ